MKVKTNYIYACASFCTAAAIGLVMQNGDARASDQSTGVIELASAVVTNPARPTRILPFAPKDTQETSLKSLTVFDTAGRVQDTLVPNPLAGDTVYNEYGLGCDTTLEAQVGAAAMVTLRLNATCHGEQQFILRHQDLTLSFATSDQGLFEIDIPAMAPHAEFEVEFVDGTRAKTIAHVPDQREFERAALVWQGNSGLQIHALEFGADYGEAGHVWFAEPRSSEFGVSARGGYLTTLGDQTGPEAWHAEVYSFPASESPQTGTIRLSIEAEVTGMNCGKQVSARSMQNGAPATALRLEMPECSVIGDFLVLKNLLQDLKIAAR